MNHTHETSEVLLAAVAQAARAEYQQRERAELSSDAFAKLRTAELEALASQVLQQWPAPGAPLQGSRARLARSGLVGLAAVAACVLAIRLVRVDDSVPARIAKEPAAPPAQDTRTLPAVPAALTDAEEARWLPDAASWLCTDSAFVDTGRDPADEAAPERAPRLWLEVHAGYEDQSATLLNRMDATPFRGQRLRLQAELEVADVTGSAGLWLRVDARERTLVRSSKGYGLSGTHGVERRDVTVDVPLDGQSIVFGAGLSGTGRLWIDDVVLDLVAAGSAASAASESEDNAAAPPPVRGGPRKRPLRPVP